MTMSKRMNGLIIKFNMKMAYCYPREIIKRISLVTWWLNSFHLDMSSYNLRQERFERGHNGQFQLTSSYHLEPTLPWKYTWAPIKAQSRESQNG